MVENCSVSSHIQPRQIFDLTDLSEKIWLFGKFEHYRFENRYYYYISRQQPLEKMKTLRLITTFYKSFAFASIIITLSCISIMYIHGIKTFTILFWFKIITLGLVVLFINNYKRKEFYYYINLGVSKKLLWFSTLLFDIILFLSLLILTLYIR